MIQENRMLEYH